MCAQEYKFREPISVSLTQTQISWYFLYLREDAVCNRFVLFCIGHCYNIVISSLELPFFAASAAVCRYLFSFTISFFSSVGSLHIRFN